MKVELMNFRQVISSVFLGLRFKPLPEEIFLRIPIIITQAGNAGARFLETF